MGCYNTYDDVVPAEDSDLQTCTPLPLKPKVLREMENIPRSINGELDHYQARRILEKAVGDRPLELLKEPFGQAILMACSRAEIVAPNQEINASALLDVYPSGDGRLIFRVGFEAQRPALPKERFYSHDGKRIFYSGEALLSYAPANGKNSMIATNAYIRRFKYDDKQQKIYDLRDKALKWAETNRKHTMEVAGDFTTDFSDPKMNDWDRFAAKRLQSNVRSTAENIVQKAGLLPPGGNDFAIVDDNYGATTWKKNILTGKYSGNFDFVLNDGSGYYTGRLNPILRGNCKVTQTDKGVEMKFSFIKPA